MDEDQARFMAISLYFIHSLRKKRESREKRQRQWWIKPWISRRLQLGAFNTLIKELRDEDTGSFLNFFRMYPNLFAEIENMIAERISREDTNYRLSVSAGERLAITIRFLATGEHFFLHYIINIFIVHIVN